MGKQTTETTQEATATPKHRRTLVLTVGSIIAAILVVIIILSSVTTQARPEFIRTGMESVEVTSAQYAWSGANDVSTTQLIPGVHDEQIADLINAYDASTKFSVGYGIMNNLWSVKMTKGDLEPKNVAEIKELKASVTGKIIVVTYSELKNAVVVGNQISYDHLFLFVNETGSALRTFSAYYVDGSKVLSNDNAYTVQEYKGWMNGTTLTDALAKLDV